LVRAGVEHILAMKHVSEMNEENVPPEELLTFREYSFMTFCSDIGERSLTAFFFAACNGGFFFRSKINLVPWLLLAAVL
jgi:hypothetical protein